MSQLTFEPLLMAERTAAGPRTSAPARIPSSSAVRQQFSRVFRHTAPSFRRQDVFRDFITLAASELDLARIRTPENVENSRRICDRYQPTDIDPMVADMAFIQLALLGIPAKVVTGNTLTLQASRVRYTPVYYFNDWEGRLAFRQRLAAMKTFMASVAA